MSAESSGTTIESPEVARRNGVIAGVLAFSMWGFLPIYFKLFGDVAASEFLVHRILWAVPFGALIITARRQWREVRAAIANRRTLGWLALSALFIACNWLLYVWAVLHEQIFQASLGYYINPLMYVLVGVLLFGERLRPLQISAVVLAIAGVSVLTFSGGQFPAIALTLAVSFTIYGVIRKQTDIGGMPGLFIETLVLAPFALGWLLLLVDGGRAAFGAGNTAVDLALLLAGPVTVLPLLCFALAARRVALSTIGFMQFIAPTLQFVIGVAYGERLTTAHVVCFGSVWLGVAAFSVDAWRRRRVPVPAH